MIGNSKLNFIDLALAVSIVLAMSRDTSNPFISTAIFSPDLSTRRDGAIAVAGNDPKGGAQLTKCPIAPPARHQIERRGVPGFILNCVCVRRWRCKTLTASQAAGGVRLDDEWSLDERSDKPSKPCAGKRATTWRQSLRWS